jgi:hypothetical protein
MVKYFVTDWGGAGMWRAALLVMGEKASRVVVFWWAGMGYADIWTLLVKNKLSKIQS